MDIKIIIALHKPYWIPDDDAYLPLHVGAEGKADLFIQKDDTGDNISSKNANFCELTGLYWAWKNISADYIGLVHYRRYFTRKEVHSIREKKNKILTKTEWEKILQYYSVVVADKRRYIIESNRSHYNHAHYHRGLDIVETIIKEKYPEYSLAFEKVMKRTWAHMFNMFVMRRDLYNTYCQWIFAILFELEKKLDISAYDKYEARVYGFIGELLLDVWLEKNKVRYKEQNVSFMEKQNWIKKGASFLERKLVGKV